MQTNHIFDSNRHTWTILVQQHGMQLLGGICLVFGLTTSYLFISLGVGMLALGGIWHFWKNGRSFSPLLNKHWLLCWFLYFFLNVLAMSYTSNQAEGWDEVVLKLPLLLLPIGLLISPVIPQILLQFWAIVYVWTVTGVSLASAYNYFIHYEQITEGMLNSGAVPIITLMPDYSHIYFGIQVCWAIYLAYTIGQSSALQRLLWLRYSLWACLVVLMVILQVFASRTGIIAFYASASVFIFIKGRSLSHRGRWKLLGLVAVGMAVVGTLAMQHKGIRLKIENTRRDLKGYFVDNDVARWSIGPRFVTWQASVTRWTASPIWGFGPADVADELDHAFQEPRFYLPPVARLHDPHNQYLADALGLGIIGLFALLLIIIWPLVNISGLRQEAYALAFVSIVLIAMCFESILERQIGICFVAFWYLWTVHYHTGHRSATVNVMNELEKGHHQ